MCTEQEIVGRPDYATGSTVIIGESMSMAAAWSVVLILATKSNVGNVVDSHSFKWKFYWEKVTKFAHNFFTAMIKNHNLKN